MQTVEERRKALRKRIIGYAITVTTIVVVATVLFFLMLGYRFNTQSGTVLQGGLVQFISEPSGAHVTVGVAELARPTNTKITLNPGKYTVKMDLDGYIPWQKDINVEAGTVQWVNSARLVPQVRETSDVAEFAKVDGSLVRQSGKIMVVMPDKSKPSFVMVPLRSSDTIETDNTIFSGSDLDDAPKQVYSLMELSSDDRWVLLKRSLEAENEVVLVDTKNPNSTVVIGPIGKILPVEATFDPRSSKDVVVRYSDNSVRLVDGDNGEVSEIILEDIAYMQMSQSSIVYASEPVKGITRTGYYSLADEEDYVLGNYETSLQTKVALRKYYSEYFVVTAIGKVLTVQSIKSLPESEEDLTKMVALYEQKLSELPLSIGFQNSNRLVFASQPSSVTSYDLELRTATTADLLGRDKNAATVPVKWLDGQHFWDDASGQLRQYEYDGTNQTSITKVAPGMAAAYSTDDKYLYSFVLKDKSYMLQRTKMILK